MANPWLSHVKQTMKKHRGVSFKQVLRIAKKTYKAAAKFSSKNKPKHHRRAYKGSRRTRQSGGNVNNGANVIASTAEEVKV